MIDLEKMAKEHEKLFPNATAESQLWKLEEEINEARANRKAVEYYTAHTHLIMHQLIDEGCTGFEKDIVK